MGFAAAASPEATEETRASPMKRSIGGFADEDDLLDFDDDFIEPPPKRARSDSCSFRSFGSQGGSYGASIDRLLSFQGERCSCCCRSSSFSADIPATALDKIPSISQANGVSTVLTAHQLTRGLLDKGKGALARMHSMIFPKATQEKTQLIDAFAVDTKEVIEVFPVPSFVDDSSGVLSESDRIQRMKDRIAQMEKDLRSTYALAAIINKKSETAADVERYALTELHKATESLNFIALNRAEESKRVHERVNALIELSSAEEIFWREHSKASAVAQFQDRVQQVHHFFDKCYKAMRVVWKTMFPLNAVPPTLLALMSEFGNAKKIRDLVRAQVFAGARFTLALVLARYPSAGLLSIANVTGDLEALYPKVLLPANIIVDRLEKDSKVPEEKGTPQG
ncbi:hypothetical protein QYE76_027864 [Lolium multiflorum]|uniref:Uncharacterized protein n=1 Tax=Lolium multiflorum TaxID=4521 RepID=A0AAD8VGG2_LOLMU|nr:hypothetical protein QYE76_027864 [Lolium multiflorum]